MNISVIVPSYKPHDYIWECLDSLRNQTMPCSDFEIILVLNGCNEPYKANIEQYLSHNLIGYNVNFIQVDMGGVSNARNLGLEAAKGEYVTFIDDDDYVSPQYLQQMYEVAVQGYTPLANMYAFNDGSGDYFVNYISKLFNRKKDCESCSINEVRSYLSMPVAKLLSRKSVGQVRFNPRFANGEDALFMFSVSPALKKYRCTSPQAIYYRRVRAGSATTSLKQSGDCFKNAIRLVSAFLSIWVRCPLKYNFMFFLSRLLAPFK